MEKRRKSTSSTENSTKCNNENESTNKTGYNKGDMSSVEYTTYQTPAQYHDNVCFEKLSINKNGTSAQSFHSQDRLISTNEKNKKCDIENTVQNDTITYVQNKRFADQNGMTYDDGVHVSKPPQKTHAQHVYDSSESEMPHKQNINKQHTYKENKYNDMVSHGNLFKDGYAINNKDLDNTFNLSSAAIKASNVPHNVVIAYKTQDSKPCKLTDKIVRDIHSSDTLTIYNVYNDIKKVKFTADLFLIVMNRCKTILYREIQNTNLTGDMFHMRDDIFIKNKMTSNINIFAKILNYTTSIMPQSVVNENINKLDLYELVNLLRSEDETERNHIMVSILNIYQYYKSTIRVLIENELCMYFEQVRTHIGLEEIIEIVLHIVQDIRSKLPVKREYDSTQEERTKRTEYSNISSNVSGTSASGSGMYIRSASTGRNTYDDNPHRSTHVRSTSHDTTDTSKCATADNSHKANMNGSTSVPSNLILSGKEIFNFYNTNKPQSCTTTTTVRKDTVQRDKDTDKNDAFFYEYVLRLLSIKQLECYKTIPSVIITYCKYDVRISKYVLKHISNIFKVVEYINRPTLLQVYTSIYNIWSKSISFYDILDHIIDMINISLSSSHSALITAALNMIETKSIKKKIEENMFYILPKIFTNLYKLSKKYWDVKGRLRVYSSISLILNMNHECFEACLVEYNKSKHMRHEDTKGE